MDNVKLYKLIHEAQKQHKEEITYIEDGIEITLTIPKTNYYHFYE